MITDHWESLWKTFKTLDKAAFESFLFCRLQAVCAYLEAAPQQKVSDQILKIY